MKAFLTPGKLMIGINYWESESAINMWTNWNACNIDEDFSRLSRAGVSVLRVFPLWPVFQPLNAINDNNGTKEYRFGEQPLPDTEAGMAGVDESACEKFEKMCDIAKKYNLKLMVGLITGHMSGRYFAPPAFQGKNPITDPTVIKWEIRFIKYFVRRMKKKSAIVGWDLGNECCGFITRNDFKTADSSYVWSAVIADTIRQSDPDRPVISGFDVVPLADDAFNIIELGENVDIHTVHPYNIFQTPGDPLVSMRPIFESAHKCRMYSDLGGIPTFVQEIGSIGYTNCSEKTEAEFYRALLFSCWSHNCLGVMWWCAFDQGMLKYTPFDWNNIGSNYGFYRQDKTEKPIVTVNRDFTKLMNELPIDCLPEHIVNAICIIPRNTGIDKFDVLRTTHCLAKQANIDLGFTYAFGKLPDSKLYIMPSVDTNQAIPLHRLEELLEKVKNGATLYVSLGTGLFRNVEELFGLTLAYKKSMKTPENVCINGKELKIKSDFKYTVEECDAEVIAYGEDKRPVFVKNSYGRGMIYFSTLAVEKYLSSCTDVFDEADAADYSVWYRCLTEETGNNKVLDTDVPLVCHTEHIIDEKSRYAVLINYSKDTVKINILLDEHWKIKNVYYGNADNNKAEIKQCDAVVLKLVKA